MFDGRKIAKQALLRANEIESKKIQRKKQRRKSMALFGLCTASVIIVILIVPFISTPNGYILNDDPISLGYSPNDYEHTDDEYDYIIIDENQIPLAVFAFPEADENAKPYTGAEQAIKIPDINNIIITADTVDINMPLYNPKENPYYFVFELILSDTGEILYKSGLIEPGMFIENLTLSRTLTTGEHDAVLKIYFYESESFVSKNRLSVTLNIIVA